MSAILQARTICKTYSTENGEDIRGVDGVDLTVAANDFVCIVGPSGCGKSTFLRIVAGLEPAGSGDVRFRGRKIRKPHPQIGMVFQEYSLFPWLSVLDNVAAGPAFAGVKKKERYGTAASWGDENLVFSKAIFPPGFVPVPMCRAPVFGVRCSVFGKAPP
jgi:NitT/TauT family transport system ATP-binding protein